VGELITYKDCSVFEGKPGVDPDKEYYDYDKSDGVDFTSSAATEKKYRYTKPGTYTVTQYARDVTGVDAPFERTFEVKGTPAPSFAATSCANRNVQVNITDTNYDLFDIDYGDGTIRSNVKAGTQPAYTYTGNGPYTIQVTGRYSGATCDAKSQQTVELLPPSSAPVISQLAVVSEAPSGELALTLDGLQPGYRYVVERGTAANYQTIDTIRSVTQATLENYRLSGINTSESARYRVRPVDRCGTSISAASNAVSSISLNATAGNELATLSWNGSSETVQRYDISRNGTIIQSLDKNARSYTDQNLTCGQNYCYTVASSSADGRTVSVSARKCVAITSTTPPPAGYLYATYDQNNHVVLTFSVPQGHEAKQVRYERSREGAPFSNLATTEQTQLTDELQAPTALCYRATYTNPCGLEAPLSNTSCPIFLKVVSPEGAAEVTLGWTGYVGFPDGIGQYTVELLDDNNQVISSYPATGNTYIDRNLSEDVQVLRYRIKVTSGNGSAFSYSNTETVLQPLQVHVPTAFTPNNDGLNDVLEIKGRFIRDFRITIYNSMGQVVFQSTDRSTGWDGTYQGKLQPAGAYAYEISIITTSGEEKRRTGTVTLLR
jgi:gliding motility-associated-like protein